MLKQKCSTEKLDELANEQMNAGGDCVHKMMCMKILASCDTDIHVIFAEHKFTHVLS